MLYIPILRHGQPYESIEKVTLVHHATGEPVRSEERRVGKECRL